MFRPPVPKALAGLDRGISALAEAVPRCQPACIGAGARDDGKAVESLSDEIPDQPHDAVLSVFGGNVCSQESGGDVSVNGCSW